MSTGETHLADENQSQDRADIVHIEEDGEEKLIDSKAKNEEVASPEVFPNASVLSASDIRASVDETTAVAESPPAIAVEAENDAQSESKVQEKVAVVEEPSNGEEEANNGAEKLSNGAEEEGWIDILANGQLMKKVLRKGMGLSTKPTPQSRVKVRTRGYLDNGKTVDRHSSVTFTVGDGDVVQAWDLVVPLMEQGETASVKTNSRFAYGALGKQPDIPPGANIRYELELLDVQPPLNFETIAEDELLKLVDQKRVRGNDLFQRKEFERAVYSYQKGLQMIQNYLEEQSGRESKPVEDMQIRCWNNIAAAQLKIDLHREALKSCEDVLHKDPNNVKALFRAGKVLSIMGEMDEAVRKLEKAKSLDSQERAIQIELEKALQKKRQTQEKERRMYRRMMEGEKPAKHEKKLQKSSLDTTWGPLPYLAAAAIIASIGIGLAYFLTQKH